MKRMTAAAVAAFVGVAAGARAGDSLNEDFDCYPTGAGISAQPGWELWPMGDDGVITDTFAFSGSNSLSLPFPRTDVLRRFSGFGGGQVVFRVMTYVPRMAPAMQAYIIALNQYDGGGPATSWSMQVRFDTALGEVESQFGMGTTPIIFDRWVELRAEIDLDADLWDCYYDGALFAAGQSWTEPGIGGPPGVPVFSAINLGGGGEGAFYIDDILVTRPGCEPAPTCGGGDPGQCPGDCYADCDDSGGLDFFDFLCFQNAFAAGDPYADCDSSGMLDFFDFLCFQNAFAAGCP
jgi:hypothetical protein